jgi:KipI family sensor histidine kinase inhibitor
VPAGDEAVVVEFGDRIDDAVNHRVYDFAATVEHAGLPGVVELVPTYRSLLVQYDLEVAGYREMVSRLEELLAEPVHAAASNGVPRQMHEIPVVYGGEYGPDLLTVAQHTGLRPDEVIRIHSGVAYRVYMLGYAPGFPYLGGMDQRIACPRLKTPRVKVLAGSVGIAESQTGVYPNDSPGGWQIIGRTPAKLFNPADDPPTAIQPGSFVTFRPVSEDEYREIKGQIAADTYRLPMRPYHDSREGEARS